MVFLLLRWYRRVQAWLLSESQSSWLTEHTLLGYFIITKGENSWLDLTRIYFINTREELVKGAHNSPGWFVPFCSTPSKVSSNSIIVFPFISGVSHVACWRQRPSKHISLFWNGSTTLYLDSHRAHGSCYCESYFRKGVFWYQDHSLSKSPMSSISTSSRAEILGSSDRGLRRCHGLLFFLVSFPWRIK